jgi:hypothetical protein
LSWEGKSISASRSRICSRRLAQAPPPDLKLPAQSETVVGMYSTLGYAPPWALTDPYRFPFAYLPCYRVESDGFTGVAICNYSTQTADLEFTAFGASGNGMSLQSNPATRKLDAHAQLAQLGREILGAPDATPQVGWIQAGDGQPGNRRVLPVRRRSASGC